jgi:hypothetical protein
MRTRYSCPRVHHSADLLTRSSFLLCGTAPEMAISFRTGMPGKKKKSPAPCGPGLRPLLECFVREFHGGGRCQSASSERLSRGAIGFSDPSAMILLGLRLP